ncbi:serine/threonine protein kinase [Streptomyces sp. C10-9-1]|uniref:serine/threonine-protein kinase n=1 Tax=Streptomyces sp. C10-9-1 TaxID=1859285 RepID=UPI0021137D34|nr:serine/threonine-protein kinase [Streptomyces sp. C10-9-1]MCQ6555454.1 serine/threonine protein kinase [Streptomyces sp. C10-9-1]
MDRLLDDRYRLGASRPVRGEETYEAWDVGLKRSVAVKVLTGVPDPSGADESGAPAAPDWREAFTSGARSAVGVTAQRLAAVQGYGACDLDGEPACYLLVEDVPGRPLRTLPADGTPELSRVLAWGIQLCEALEPLHAAGLVHADIGPGNVVVTEDDGVVLGAPSVARLAGRPASGGAVECLSPELAAGRDGIDSRSDLYSLGCLLYLLVAGRAPFTGSRDEVLRLHQESPPEPSWRHASLVPQRLDHLIRDLLEKDPQRRPDGVRAVADRLREIAEGPLPRSARPPHPARPGTRSAASAPGSGTTAAAGATGSSLRAPAGGEGALPLPAAVATGLTVATATAVALTAFTSLGVPAAAGLTALALAFWPVLARTTMSVQGGRERGQQAVGCGMALVCAAVGTAAVVLLPWRWWFAVPVGVLIAAGAAFASVLLFSLLVGGPLGVFRRFGYPWTAGCHAAAGAAVVGVAVCAAAGFGPETSWWPAVRWGLGCWAASGAVLAVLLIGYRGRPSGP